MVVDISQRAQIPVPGGGGGGDGARTDGGMRQVVAVVCRDSRCVCTHANKGMQRGAKNASAFSLMHTCSVGMSAPRSHR